jgi:diguanylate cyclase
VLQLSAKAKNFGAASVGAFVQITIAALVLVASFMGGVTPLSAQPAVTLSDEAAASEIIAVFPKSFPPYYMTDDKGNPTGFAIDVIEEVAERAGLKLRFDVKDTWKDVEEALRSGRGDLIPNLGVADHRKEFANFTTPMDTFRISVFVRREEERFGAIDDLAAHTVGARESNVAEKYVAEIDGVDLRIFHGFTEMLDALIDDQIDAFAYPEIVAWWSAAENDAKEEIDTLGRPLHEISRAIAVRKDLPELHQILDEELRRFVSTPEFDSIYREWTGASASARFLRWSNWWLGSGLLLVTIMLVASALVLGRKYRKAIADDPEIGHDVGSRDSRRVLALILVMAVVALSVTTIAIVILYNSAIEEQEKRLSEIVQSHAQVAKAVAKRELAKSKSSLDEAKAESISALLDGLVQLSGSIEFTVGIRDGDNIEFLLRQRSSQRYEPAPISFSSPLAEPMRRALHSESGSVIGLDYRNEEVFAAYAPVEILDLGVVAKIDMSEIRAPFIRAGIIVAGAAIVIIVFGVFVFHLVSNPIIRNMRSEIIRRRGAEIALKAATQEAIDREERISAVVETVVEGIITIDTLGTIATFNPAAERIFGYSAGETIGQNVKLLMPEPYHSEHDGYLKHFHETGERRLIGNGREATGRHKDGSAIPLALGVSEMTVGGQQMFTGVVRDITERHRAEAKIQEQKQQLDGAVGNIVQGLVMYDPDGRLVLWNQRFIEMYGLSPAVVKAGCSGIDVLRHLKEVVNFSQDPEELHQNIIARQADGKPWAILRDLHDGRTIHIAHSPMADGGRVSTHEDVTENREQKLQLDAAVNNMAQGLTLFDGDERLILVNHRYVKMYGLSPDIVKPGVSLLEVLEHRKERGALGIDPREQRDYILARNAEGEPWSQLFELPNNRFIQFQNQPLLDGRWISTHEDVTERKRSERQIEYLASHDILTTLPNRRSFNEFLSGAMEEAARDESKIGVLSVDLDRLKEVNDVFGHAAGDLLLRKVADRLQSTAGSAFVARSSGDEFKIVLTDGKFPTVAVQLAERLQSSMVEEFDLDDHVVQISICIGVAIYPDDGSDATTLLANGDAAVFRAKSEGRNRVCFFDSEMDKELHERRILQEDFRSAIGNDELRLVYQPQARISGEIIGFEALARWHHPKRGLVGPDVFIPIAEDIGLILELGEWVLREACREAAGWDQDLTIAVNLSPVQFKHGDLPKLVETILTEAGLAPERLELEITETALVEDFARATAIVNRLKEIGVKIAMDDFGTGYSSLSYLQSFPFDKIKIDKSFIAELNINNQSPTIVRTIIGLAHSLSLPVLAEGVETKEQLEFLEEEGCNEIQGFLIGRPKNIGDYAEIVAKVVQRS